jgi:hypothetical protein
MIYISHRGNLDGPNPSQENNPVYIEQAINEGFSVEVDFRIKDGRLYLGHDEPQYEISFQWLQVLYRNLWIHCKDKEAFNFALSKSLHCFWHNIDDYTITSEGYVWAYPGKEPAGRYCILVMPDTVWPEEKIHDFDCLGLCSDNIRQLKIKSEEIVGRSQ